MIWLILACIASAILYRIGGAKGYNTRFRDIGCSLTLLTLVALSYGKIGAFWWAYLLCFGLSWGALASYWGQDEKEFGYFWHGLGCGLAGLPLLMIVPLWIIITRLVVCTFGIMLWSEYTKNDVVEELGRGVLFIL